MSSHSGAAIDEVMEECGDAGTATKRSRIGGIMV